MSGANPDPHYFAQDKNRSPYNYLSRRGCENGRRLARILDTSKSRMPLDVKHAGLTAFKKTTANGEIVQNRSPRSVMQGGACSLPARLRGIREGVGSNPTALIGNETTANRPRSFTVSGVKPLPYRNGEISRREHALPMIFL